MDKLVFFKVKKDSPGLNPVSIKQRAPLHNQVILCDFQSIPKPKASGSLHPASGVLEFHPHLTPLIHCYLLLYCPGIPFLFTKNTHYEKDFIPGFYLLRDDLHFRVCSTSATSAGRAGEANGNRSGSDPAGNEE
jgi:hypothetical protein